MNEPMLFLPLIPLLPFVGFLLNGVLGSKLPKALVSTIALAFPLASFALVARAAWMVYSGLALPVIEHGAPEWIVFGAVHIGFGLALDQLTLVMLLVITGVGFLIHLYSVGYMEHEQGYWRYFAYLNLFLFFMTVLVLASNFLLMFVGWEGVGLASYLLIGFYIDRRSAGDAGKKAFVVNRIGDFGFLIAMFLLLGSFGTLNFSEVAAQLAGHAAISGGVVTLICLCLLLGATGKSAQIPLYIWLPDAMEGPTPVSALIHAATMVTAGVYMIARAHALFDLSPTALLVVAILGTATAFFAATVAMVQTDIKRVLAYSTISQLGYMFLGCGVGAYSAAVFHLMTHAFFKALLFLAAGSVIHGLGGEQDLRRMGGLRKQMPVTFWTMTAAVLAIAGFFPFAGFFSKDAILAAAFQHGVSGKALWTVGLTTALLTSFYMFRLWYLTFLGESRADGPADSPANGHGSAHAGHAHESPWIMLTPLVVLAALSVCGGWIGMERFGAFLAPVTGGVQAAAGDGGHIEMMLSALAVLVAAAGWFVAHSIYGRARNDRANASLALPRRVLERKYWVDEIYVAGIVRPLEGLARYGLGWVGEWTLVRGSAWLLAGVASLSGEFLRRWQSGNLRSYAAWLTAAAAILLIFVLAGTLFGINGFADTIHWAVR